MRTIGVMIAELDVVRLHARRARLALNLDRPDYGGAREEIAHILAAVPELHAIYHELCGRGPLPPGPGST